MTHDEALQYWLKTYDSPYTVEDAKKFYEQEKLRGFSGYASEKECLEDIEKAKRWSQLDNWELEFHMVVTNEAELNNPQNTVSQHQDWGDCMPDHAEEEGLCKDSIRVPLKPGEEDRYGLGYHYQYQFTSPFIVRVFYRKDSDYEVAFVFTNLADDKILAISQRED